MKKKILVVDDDRVMLKFFAKLLAREGHDVFTAEDGFAALNLLATFGFGGLVLGAVSIAGVRRKGGRS